MTGVLVSPESCLHAAELLATMASAVLSAHGLSQRRFYAGHGMAAWKGHRHPRMAQWVTAAGMDKMFRYRATVVLLALKLLSALWVFACLWTSRSPAVPLATLVALTSYWHLRLPLAIDGSDQFAYLTLIAATAAEFLHSETAAVIALTFIAAQAALAYATAGFLKLGEKGWYDGSHISYVLSTATSGHAELWLLFQTHRGLARWSGRLFVLCECLLPFAALLPPPACAVLLCLGVVLHAAIARVMGFNTFLWAFSASYPASFYLSTRLYAR